MALERCPRCDGASFVATATAHLYDVPVMLYPGGSRTVEWREAEVSSAEIVRAVCRSCGHVQHANEDGRGR